jgi:nicotinamidase-related amidase
VSQSDLLSQGPLTSRTVHLCVDMQRVFAEDTPWHMPWMVRVLPVIVDIAQHRPAQTIFTRFIPPPSPDRMPGTWRRYYARWRSFTGEQADPRLFDLVAPLASLAPPAAIIDKMVYSPFFDPALLTELRRRGADSLVITGVETDVCVLATVLAAIDHGYRVVLPADALSSSSDSTHDALMTLYSERFSEQIEVASSETILSCWL